MKEWIIKKSFTLIAGPSDMDANDQGQLAYEESAASDHFQPPRIIFSRLGSFAAARPIGQEDDKNQREKHEN